MSGFSKRLQLLRKEHRLNAEELATKFNVAKSTISHWETGRRSPSFDMLIDLANHFNVSTDYLLGKSDIRDSALGISPMTTESAKNMTAVPILAAVYLGGLDSMKTVIEEYEYINLPTSDHENYFFMRVTNDSMQNARIQEGDLVLVYQTEKIKHNDLIVAGRKQKSAEIRRYRFVSGQKWLMPENPKYDPELFDSELHYIIGKAIKVCYDLM